MTGILAATGPEGAALALLVLGHALGDFAFQTDGMVENKHRWGPLLAHGAVLAATHAIVLAPMLTLHTAGIVVAVAASHVLVDGVKARLGDPTRDRLGVFVADQAVHLLVLLVAWTFLEPTAWTASPVVRAVDGVPYQAWSTLTKGAVYVSAFVFAHHGGNALVRGVLPEPSPEPSGGVDLEAGATIGTLERWIVLLLALAGQWEAVVLVVAAKSIARFEELKERAFAEYFLVGTLASVLVAIGLALSVQALV